MKYNDALPCFLPHQYAHFHYYSVHLSLHSVQIEIPISYYHFVQRNPNYPQQIRDSQWLYH